MKYGRTALFCAASLAAFAVVSYNVVCCEAARRCGTEYRFPVNAYDPHDLFRGRYLQFRLSVRPRTGSASSGGEERMYAILGNDGSGSYVERIETEKPCEGDFLIVRRRWNRDSESVFERFYLNEDAAPRAEKLLSGGRVEAVLKVRGGFAYLADLQLDGRSLRDAADWE